MENCVGMSDGYIEVEDNFEEEELVIGDTSEEESSDQNDSQGENDGYKPGIANGNNRGRQKSQSPELHDSVAKHRDEAKEINTLIQQFQQERINLVQEIEAEDKNRKWYYDQIEMLTRKIRSLPVSESFVSKQPGLTRKHLEFEVKRLRETMHESFGTNEQIAQRQEQRIQKIHSIESEIMSLQKHKEKLELDGEAELLPHGSQGKNFVQKPQGKVGMDNAGYTDYDDGEQITTATQTQDSLESDGGLGLDEESARGHNLSAMYHGAWPINKDYSRDREGSIRSFGQDVASVMSFNSSNTSSTHSSGPMAPQRRSSAQSFSQPHQQPQPFPQSHQQPQQLGTKVEMVYSLLSMLGTHDKDDMSRTLLAMSNSQDSCIAMRQSGCLPLLIQLLHGSDKDSSLLGNTRGSKAARARAAAALHNIVHSHPDDKRGRREARVLRLLEQIRAHCDQLRDSSSDEEDESRNNSRSGSRSGDMDHHPGPAIATLMKLSFDEEHRHAICTLGGLHAIAELLQVDHEINGNTTEQYNITMRRYACMALTNLTFGDGTNKALLCSMKSCMEALVEQLHSTNEDLCQVAASVLRNLSWKADLASKKTLREVGAVTTLMRTAMRVKKETTLKSILSALWNLSAHCSENKADICAVEGALEFLVGSLTYKSPSKTMSIIENGGGILRNVSSHIAVREDYRKIIREHGCLQILLKHLRSTSLTIVSNACGTLWNLSARCAEDQQALWEMGAVNMLRNLVHSKHKMISMGSSAALKNLLAARPAMKNLEIGKQANSNRPTLHVRKQRALEADIDQNLSETCENVESPRDSPVDNSKLDKDHSRFVYPRDSNLTHVVETEPRRSILRGQFFPRSQSGDNSPVLESRLKSPQRVARSGSQDSVGSTHSDISHDRSYTHGILGKTRTPARQGGSLERNVDTPLQRYNSDVSCERNQPNSRILQVMQEVAKHAGLDSPFAKEQPKDNVFKVPQGRAPKVNEHSVPPQHMMAMQQAMLYHRYLNGNHMPVPQPILNLAHNSSMGQNFGFSHPGSHSFPQEDEGDQPIDFSVKYRDSNMGIRQSDRQAPDPPRPMVGNYVGSPYIQRQGMSFMHNSYGGGHAGNFYEGRSQQFQKFGSSAYAETDLDDPDQTTDYSARYGAEYTHYSDQSVSYNSRYDGRDPNCADCKLEEARRMNDQYEQYSTDQVKTFCTEGTPYLSTATSLTDLTAARMEEGESYKRHNHSHANVTQTVGKKYGDSEVLKSESEKSSGSGSQKSDPQTGTTVITNSHKAKPSDFVPQNQSASDERVNMSFHANADDDSSQDQPKTYCEEGTPVCFSRVSSLSSLHSSEAADRLDGSKQPRPQVALQSIDENEDLNSSIVRMPPPSMTSNALRLKSAGDSDSRGEMTEKEHKTVTFDDNHHVEETPLMFSRCTSLGSLSSFDAHSVHSSVVSEYSRRASEVVSPSELPDSPSETMPPSPKRSKSPERSSEKRTEVYNPEALEPKQFTNKAKEGVKKVNPVNSQLPNPRTESDFDSVSTMSKEVPMVYEYEGTPPHFSETSSLSALTIDDKRKDSMNDNVKGSIVEKSREVKPEPKKVEPKDPVKIEDKDSSMSEVSEGEEDILANIISSAMPNSSSRRMRKSSSDNAIKKKSSGNSSKTDSGTSSRSKTPAKTSSNDGKSAGSKPAKRNLNLSGKASSNDQLSSDRDVNEDSVKPYAEEGPPCSIPTSQLQIAKPQARFAPSKIPKFSNLRHMDASRDTVHSYADEDIPFTVARTQKILSKPGYKTAASTFNPKSVIGTRNLLEQDPFDTEDEVPKPYATEDTPFSGSHPSSPPAKIIQNPLLCHHPNLPELEINDDCVKSFATEGTPLAGSNIPSPQPKPGHVTDRFTEVFDYGPHAEDTVKCYATEDTPLTFSQTGSLSDLSIMTGMSDNDREPVQNAKSSQMSGSYPPPPPDDSQSDTSSVLEEGEDLLSEIIQSAMPKGKGKKSMDRQAEGSEGNDKFRFENPSYKEKKPVVFQPHRTSSHISKNEIDVDTVKVYAVEDTPINFSSATSLSDLTIDSIEASKDMPSKSTTDKSYVSNTATFGTSNDSVFLCSGQCDSPKLFMLEGTPVTFSLGDSLSSLSCFDEDKSTASEQMKKSTKLMRENKDIHQQVANNIACLEFRQSHKSSDSLNSGKYLERHVIGQSSEESQSVSRANPSQIKQLEDQPKKYTVEDTPMCFSNSSSLSSLHSPEGEKSKEREEFEKKSAAKDQKVPYKVEDTPVCFSRNSSLSSLSVDTDEDDPTPSEQALLDECISSALPKRRSSRSEERHKGKSKSSHSGSFGFQDENRKYRTLPKTSSKHKDKTYGEIDRKNRDAFTSQNSKSRSLSATEDTQGTHDSRITVWRKQPHRSSDEIFLKPSTDAKGRPLCRSHSEDSDYFLKDRKEASNMEIFHQSKEILRQRPYLGSFDSIPRPDQMTDSDRIHEEIRKETEKITSQLRELSTRDLESSTEKTDSEKEKETSPEEDQNMYFMTCSAVTEISVESISKQSFPSSMAPDTDDDILGGSLVGAAEIDDESKLGYPEEYHADNTLTSRNLERHYLEVEMSLEDQRALEQNANIIVSELQINRTMTISGSTVDEDNFIENETLSLVSNDYMSDTASEASITWSLSTDRTSEMSEIIISNSNCSSPSLRRPRILKPGEKSIIPKEMECDGKGIRGKRKPLYSRSASSPSSPRSGSSRSDNISQGSRAHSTGWTKLSPRSSGVGAPSGKKVSPKTSSGPQSSSTPYKVSQKIKTNKQSPPQHLTAQSNKKSLSAKTNATPSKIPSTKNSPKSKNAASSEKPIPMVKQGTFTKESEQTNAPVISSISQEQLDENASCDEDEIDSNIAADQSLIRRRERDLSGSNSIRNSRGSPSGSWSKALESYSFIADSDQENTYQSHYDQTQVQQAKKDKTMRRSIGTANLTSGKKNLGTSNSPGSSPSSKIPSRTTQSRAVMGMTVKKTSASSSPSSKSGNSASPLKNGSGNGISKIASNPNLRRVEKGSDVRRSDSNGSLKSNSRPSTPVGRKLSAPNTAQSKTTGTSPKQGGGLDADRRVGNGYGKKQTQSKIANLWRKEDEVSQSPPSKLPVSSSMSRLAKQMKNKQQVIGRTSSPRPSGNKAPLISQQQSTDSPKDGLSRSSTFDKLSATNDASCVPSCDDFDDYGKVESDGKKAVFSLNDAFNSEDQECDMQSKSLSKEKLDVSTENVLKEKHTGSLNKSENKLDIALGKGEQSEDNVPKINSGTWKKKKADTDFALLPNADETSKPFSMAKRADSLNFSLSGSASEEGISDISFSANSGGKWHTIDRSTPSQQMYSDDTDVWVKRQDDSICSQSQMDVSSKSKKKGTKGSSTFLPIKAVAKQIFGSSKSSQKLKKEKEMSKDEKVDKSDKGSKKHGAENESGAKIPKSSKSDSKSKSFSKKCKVDSVNESIVLKKSFEDLDIDIDNSVLNSSAVCMELSKDNKNSLPNNKEQNKSTSPLPQQNGGILTQETKTSPQALVAPFNYNPNPRGKPDTSENIEIKKDSVSNPQKVSGPPSPSQHLTKTEMLMARRQQTILSGRKFDDDTENEQDGKKKCIVTTV
ncbi:hypothetical protein CHS0354_025487 [Potamilus streckersoni]|uniref:Adenomatous polyposis coli protein n=1 Tax=Potamilus streckersoni TaxID=2493646 RepID=A0AAE0RRG7_9BIVA|nr:hypothetical protein CHS0354_025487 [Potamilus streckersoni]